jgi:DNA-binding NarL/FixJ family response regulator
MLPDAPVRVAVANDYELVVMGLAAMLQPYEDRVAVRDAVLVGEEIAAPVDIVLYDTFGRVDDADTAVKTLLTSERVGRVVVYTSAPRPSHTEAALDAGAAGVLSKARPAVAVVDALERIHRGEQVLDDGGGTQQSPWPGAGLGLTSRQSEVVALLLQGLTNAEIAAALYVDVNTVKTHLRHIYKTLGTTSRSQVLAKLLPGSDFLRR